MYRAAGEGATPAYLKFTGGTATLTDDALLDGSGISIAGGTVQAGGPQHLLQLSDGTTLDLTNGTLQGAVQLTSPGSATFRWTEIQGNVQCTCFETDGLGTSGTLTISPSITFDLPGNGAHHLNGTRDLDNFGTITLHDNSDLAGRRRTGRPTTARTGTARSPTSPARTSRRSTAPAPRRSSSRSTTTVW